MLFYQDNSVSTSSSSSWSLLKTNHWTDKLFIIWPFIMWFKFFWCQKKLARPSILNVFTHHPYEQTVHFPRAAKTKMLSHFVVGAIGGKHLINNFKINWSRKIYKKRYRFISRWIFISNLFIKCHFISSVFIR